MGVNEAYQEKVDAQLREWQVIIQRFKENKGSLIQGRRIDSRRMMERLEDGYSIAQSRLNELKAASGQNWELVKNRVEQAMIELKRLLDESGAVREENTLRLQPRHPIFEPFEKKE